MKSPTALGGLDELKQTLVDAAGATLRRAIEKLPENSVTIDTRVLWGHTAMEVSRVVLQESSIWL